MSLSRNSQKADSTNQGDHRNRSPRLPQILIQAQAMHWKITNFFIVVQETPIQLPTIKPKSMLNKEPLLLQYKPTRVDTPNGTQGTCV